MLLLDQHSDLRTFLVDPSQIIEPGTRFWKAWKLYRIRGNEGSIGILLSQPKCDHKSFPSIVIARNIARPAFRIHNARGDSQKTVYDEILPTPIDTGQFPKNQCHSPYTAFRKFLADIRARVMNTRLCKRSCHSAKTRR